MEEGWTGMAGLFIGGAPAVHAPFGPAGVVVGGVAAFAAAVVLATLAGPAASVESPFRERGPGGERGPSEAELLASEAPAVGSGSWDGGLVVCGITGCVALTGGMEEAGTVAGGMVCCAASVAGLAVGAGAGVAVSAAAGGGVMTGGGDCC